MRRNTTIVVLGVLVALVPFLGIPLSWKTAFSVLFGLIIAVCAFSLRSALRAHFGDSRRVVETYAQNGGLDGGPREHHGGNSETND